MAATRTLMKTVEYRILSFLRSNESKNLFYRFVETDHEEVFATTCALYEFTIFYFLKDAAHINFEATVVSTV